MNNGVNTNTNNNVQNTQGQANVNTAPITNNTQQPTQNVTQQATQNVTQQATVTSTQQPAIENTTTVPVQNQTSQPVIQQPQVVSQPVIQPVVQTQKEEPKTIDLSNHPQNIVNDTKVDSYQASSSKLNSEENPTNQNEDYIPNPDDMKNSNNDNYEEPKVKKRSKLTPILLLIILGLGGYLFFITKDYQSKMTQMKYNCTPVTSYKEEKELDINSTIVQDLYGKVHTNIREDIAQPEWDDTMKLYLAYRQISDHDKYESNCNMFNPSLMEPYTCVESASFTPHAFKKDKLILEWKKLFGEETPLNLTSIKLKNACIGGYEYIESRGEFVEGYCDIQNATSYKMEKELTKATTYRNTIILRENVKYHPGEKNDLPEYLKSGEYIYTFRLDMNYNYILISKVYNDKYNN